MPSWPIYKGNYRSSVFFSFEMLHFPCLKHKECDVTTRTCMYISKSKETAAIIS